MTIVASLLFVVALVASIAVMLLTIRSAMPRIREVVDMEFAPSVQRERRIILGEMRRPVPAPIIAFPVSLRPQSEVRLAA